MSIPDSGLTTQLAQFVASAHTLQLPPGAVRTVTTGFLDTVAVIAAARDEPVVRIARDFSAARGGAAQEAGVLLGAGRAGVREAAFVNAIAAHAQDYDDAGLQGHPSAVLVPTLLAEAGRSKASGMDLLRAYVAGYELWAELLGRDADLHHLKGWHPTGVFGTVAAAAAVAALRRLDPRTCRHALGLAASMAAGLTANFGSMAKPFHAGRAAANGIDAVDLAQAGMTASPDVLEHKGGMLHALSPKGRVNDAPLREPLGRSLKMSTLGLAVKKYPMCFATHRVIDAALDLKQAHGVHADAVESMQACIGLAQAGMLRNHAPTSALEAKFSIEFAVAAALVAGKVGLAELRDEFVARPDVQALMRRLQIVTTDTRHPHEPTLAASDRLVITQRDGQRLDSGEVVDARGCLQVPLREQELQAKFMDCTASLDPALREALWDRLGQLETPGRRGLGAGHRRGGRSLNPAAGRRPSGQREELVQHLVRRRPLAGFHPVHQA
jgi:aconitate decarboxylase